MLPLSQRLKSSSRQESAGQSPLLRVRRLVVEETQKQFASLKIEMMQEFKKMLMEVVGENGVATLKGDPGRTPLYGVDYLTPRERETLKKELRGRDGRDGRDGKDATAPSATKIAKEMLRLMPKHEEKPITIADIKGLKEVLTSISSKKGGGGTGNVTHEHKSVSSATTTVSTASKIAGAGYALWVFYNGQMIARGTDYTVGSDQKTLTLNFTPSDSTVLDIIYFRT